LRGVSLQYPTDSCLCDVLSRSNVVYPVQYASAANLPRKSPRFAASVIAAYIFFGYTMYSILKDFRWFIAKHHGWLQRFCARNYTILVRNLPDELRTDSALKKHFEGICGAGRVLEANVCLHITHLQMLVKKRADCIWSLEHALAELAMKVKRTKHLVLLKAVGNAVRRGEQRQLKVDSIDHFTKELQNLNQEIDQLISSIEQSQHPKLFREKTLKLERLPTKSNIEDNMNSSIALELENYG
jgi:Cytosolic domain of 10TM putative phosphate transporter